jgi:hypothetical protein
MEKNSMENERSTTIRDDDESTTEDLQTGNTISISLISSVAHFEPIGTYRLIYHSPAHVVLFGEVDVHSIQIQFSVSSFTAGICSIYENFRSDK